MRQRFTILLTTDITGGTVDVGTDVHDKAIVTGSLGTPTGTVDFTLYDNGACDGTVISTEDNVPLVGGIAESGIYTTVAEGSFSYMVHYDGDGVGGLYDPADGPCEPFTVVNCEVEVDKQVSCDNVNWYDVTNDGDLIDQAPDCQELNGQDVHSRYIVSNLGTTDVECSISDDNPAFTVGPADDVTIAVNGDPATSSTFTAECNDGFENNEPNTATVNCDCLVGAVVVATRTDSDIANIECLSCEVKVDKAVSCNNEQYVDQTLVDHNEDLTNGCTANNGEDIDVQYRASNVGEVGLINCTIGESNTLIGDGVQTSFDIDDGETSDTFTDDDQVCSEELDKAEGDGDTADIECTCVDPAEDDPAEQVTAYDMADFDCVGEGCLLIIDEDGIDNGMYNIERAAPYCGLSMGDNDYLVNDKDWLYDENFYSPDNPWLFPDALLDECEANELPLRA